MNVLLFFADKICWTLGWLNSTYSWMKCVAILFWYHTILESPVFRSLQSIMDFVLLSILFLFPTGLRSYPLENTICEEVRDIFHLQTPYSGINRNGTRFVLTNNDTRQAEQTELHASIYTYRCLDPQGSFCDREGIISGVCQQDNIEYHLKAFYEDGSEELINVFRIPIGCKCVPNHRP